MGCFTATTWWTKPTSSSNAKAKYSGVAYKVLLLILYANHKCIRRDSNGWILIYAPVFTSEVAKYHPAHSYKIYGAVRYLMRLGIVTGVQNTKDGFMLFRLKPPEPWTDMIFCVNRLWTSAMDKREKIQRNDGTVREASTQESCLRTKLDVYDEELIGKEKENVPNVRAEVIREKAEEKKPTYKCAPTSRGAIAARRSRNIGG